MLNRISPAFEELVGPFENERIPLNFTEFVGISNIKQNSFTKLKLFLHDIISINPFNCRICIMRSVVGTSNDKLMRNFKNINTYNLSKKI